MKRSKTSVPALILASWIALGSAEAAEFGIFGDVLLRDTDAPSENTAFELGALDFFGSWAISDDTRAFVEYVFENSNEGLVTDLERLWVSRTLSDKLTIAAGRFHSSLGHWNRTYHHGAMLQDTVTRPFFLDFEDGSAGVLPVHAVGIMAYGELDVAGGTLAYEATLANGPSLDTTAFGLDAAGDDKPEIDINVSSDADNSKSPILRLVYAAEELPIRIGVFGMQNAIAESGLIGGTGVPTESGDDLVSQTILGFDFLYSGDKADLLAEYYNLNNDNEFSGTSTAGTVIAEGSHSGTAWFAQAGYKLARDLKIIYRHAELSFDDGDAYFALLGTEEAKHDTLGLRYDMDETNVLKFEINNAAINGRSDETTYTVQWAFLVP